MSNEYEGEREYEEEAGLDVTYSDFVNRIVQDPNKPPDVRILSGFLGASSEKGHVRLYLDEELSNYVEIPQRTIRYTQEIPREQSPLGGHLIWVDRNAEVLSGKAGTERTRATFLEGQILKEFGGGAAGGAAAQLQTLAGACVSQLNVCIPPTEVGPRCNTLTGILCTRIGVLCRQSAFNPACTRFGPGCPSVFAPQCVSVQVPCVTQDLRCQVSGFAGCQQTIPDPTIFQQPGQEVFAAQADLAGFAAQPQIVASRLVVCPTRTFICQPSKYLLHCPTVYIPLCPTIVCVTRDIECQASGFVCNVIPDPTIVQQPGVQQQFAAQAFAAPGGGFGGIGGIGGAQQTGFNCPSVFDNCATQESFCPSQLTPCQSQFNLCVTRSRIECPVVSADIRCPQETRDIPCLTQVCPTRSGPRCIRSQIAVCQTQVCGLSSAVCAVAGGGQQFEAQAFAAQPAAGFGGAAAAIQPTRFCPSQLLTCQTRYNCPSQFIRCPSAVDACPTRFGCQSVNIPCLTRFGSCETVGACPSAVDACPSRFGCESLAGCFESQACGVSQACGGGGFGGGGFNPGGGFGGGGFGGF